MVLGSGGFDWSSVYCLLPVECVENDGVIIVRAGGEELRFRGCVLAINGKPAPHRICTGNGQMLTLTGAFRADRACVVETVEWFRGEMSGYDESVVHSTQLQDTAVFFRKGDTSIFISLDFPCSRVDGCLIAFEPYQKLAAGDTYAPESVTICAVRLSGVMAGGFDRAEIEGFCAYVEGRFPNRFDRPVTSTACITNRMTDVRDGRVFYSMFDNPTLYLSPGVLKEEVRLCAELGIEYDQVFEGKFDWPDTEACGRNLEELVALGKALGVRVGDYIHPGELYCPHYNYEHRALNKPEWRRRNQDGSPGQLCFGCDEFTDFLIADLVEHNKRYGEEMITLDMLFIGPCHNPAHKHGDGGLYKQAKGLCRFMAALAGLSDNYLIWTNSGNWLEFMPKLLWYNPNVYLTDPHSRQNSPSISMLKYFDDCRREQMVSVHNSHFVPYRYFTNCEYYLCGHGRVHDIHFFEYGILQGLAVTPNLCLAEIRTFLNKIPYDRHAFCKAFIAKWIGFMKANFRIWSRTWQIGGAPGDPACEAYAHTSGSRGFVCFVNQDPYAKRQEIALDGRIGLDAGDKFDLTELYPMESRCAESPLPYASYGDIITFEIPAYSVRYIRIEPYQTQPGSLAVYGLPAEAVKTEEGYSVMLRAPQGSRRVIGLVLPEGERLACCSAEPVRTVRMYTFPAGCRLLSVVGNTARVEVTFPREEASRELTWWSAGGEPVYLPASDSEFTGAYIHNLFSEDYAVTLKLAITQPGEAPVAAEAPAEEAAAGNVNTHCPAMPNAYSAMLRLPFIEMPIFSRAYGWDEVMELCFRDPGKVKNITCEIGGKPAPVLCYRYPARPDLCQYYMELTGIVSSGEEQEIKLQIQWNS